MTHLTSDQSPPRSQSPTRPPPPGQHLSFIPDQVSSGTPLVPVYSDPLGGVYHIDIIAVQLERLVEVAAHTQLNRHCIDLAQQDPGWSGQW